MIQRLAFAVLFFVATPVFAQTRPALKPAADSTPDEVRRIEAATALHDQGKFDEAIAQYQEILTASPANMTALYELAFSYLGKKEPLKAREAAERGTEYASQMLPMFFDLIAESYDAEGSPERAIQAYERGIAAAPGTAVLYHNMAITYLEGLNRPDEARRTLQKGADADPTEAAIHLMLGQVYRSSGYETPAFFAFSTFLVFEANGPRSLQAIGFWRQILRGGLAASSGAPAGPAGGAMRDSATPAMRQPPAAANAAPTRKTDEGDFSEIDAQYAIGQQKVIDAMDNGASEMPPLLAQVDDLLARIAARPAAMDQNTFVGRHYVRYFAEIKRRNLVEPFVYWVLQRAPVNGVRDWLTSHRPRVQEFIDFTKSYEWPRP